ncbi:MAG: epoxide hydrolase N-terminal domain-containing protein, partial [Halioglobus sp.]|nr:epoxide hydrolase N-terminal domain-containing protein [Halioglobus sp.]
MSTDITPYKVAIPDAELQDLKRRLENVRWPDRETCRGWDQGMPLDYARQLASYWASDYSWRKFESKLNSWPQFITTIDDIDIHFIHVRSPREDALPIIISHGWPGSAVEFHKVIDELA